MLRYADENVEYNRLAGSIIGETSPQNIEIHRRTWKFTSKTKNRLLKRCFVIFNRFRDLLTSVSFVQSRQIVSS